MLCRGNFAAADREGEMNMEQEKIRQTEELLSFIRKSPTAFHAVESVGEFLSEQGFQRLEESDRWHLTVGKGYFVTRNQSSVIAFRVPKKAERVLIAASHTDSPMFKLKKNCEVALPGKYLKLDTEGYGGTILSTWMDRPLSVAGRVILRRDGTFTAKTVCVDRDLVLIPSVAIHMNRQVNEGYRYNPAVDLVPLFGGSDAKEGALKAILAEQIGCDPAEIVGSDLYVYNRMPGSIWGAEREFFSAPRIDNLMCLRGTLAGFCEANENDSSLTVLFSADNEETGSATRQGAGSEFLRNTLERVCEALGEDLRCLLASSYMVSADNGHAVHPNHPELCDPANAPLINGGVVIKSNASQLYATDGVSEAVFSAICSDAGVPVQYFSNRSDMRGGSTLGSISDTKVPLATVDIGMAQLAMHSSYETAGTADVAHLSAAIKRFYESRISCPRDGELRLCHI